MNYKHKSILLLSFLSIFLLSKAQVSSPYSQFGFGNKLTSSYEQSKAMGGIGIGLRSNLQLNRLNPASYSEIDSLSVIYAIGVNTGFNNIETKTDKLTKTDTRFGYFALGFKGNKYWGASFGLAPATSVDYTYKYSETNAENGNIDYYFHGSGGLNKIYWGNSFKINNNLSIGINAAYLFGAIKKVSTIVFANDYSADNTKIGKQLNVYDFTFDYGIQYKINLKEKSELILGAVYENKIKMNSKQSITAGTVANSTSIEDEYYKDVYYNDLLSVTLDTTGIKSTVTMPHAFGLGFTYSYKQKLLVGADLYQQMWSGINNDIYNASHKNLLTLNGGLEFTPDYNSVNYYYKRIRYRFGGHFTNSNLEIKNTRIKDYGISFGFGLPLRNTRTTFNLAFELGRRGTMEQNLLQETYGIASLNISLSDIWFVKRKFK